jgi:hypothetical protein
MPNLGYHLARLRGNITRGFYRVFLPLVVRRSAKPRGSVGLDVFSYSGESALPEQIASIRSFLRHVGRPRKFTVVSDGSYSKRSIRLLQQVDSSVDVQLSSGPPPANLPEKIRAYLADHPTGKQLAVIMSLPAGALYVDSDVLFFPSALDLAARVQDTGVSAYYLGDCQFAGDARLLHAASEQAQPVNTGVLLLLGKIDWSLGLTRLLELKEQPNFFSNQTVTHLVMHANGAQPFDPVKYVLQLDDQFAYTDHYAGAALALRHYVNPVRHKFWSSLIH